MKAAALHRAAETGDLATLAVGLDEGGLEERSRNGAARTPLLSAVIAGQAECVRLLLDRGADLTARDKALDYDALAWAVEGGHAELVALLLQRGADPNTVVGSTGQPVLHLGVRAVGVLAQLLAAGADPNRLDRAGNHALDRADAATTDLLLAHGAVRPQPAPQADLPWPEVDPEPDFTDPVAVTRACIVALAAWNSAAIATLQDPAGNLEAEIERGQAIADRYLSARQRRYRLSSVGVPGPTDRAETLRSVEYPRTGRCEVFTREPDTSPLGYERRYVLLRKGGQWRIDSVADRLPGELDWDPVYL